MRYKLVTLVLILLTQINAIAQYENIWSFGDYAGLDFNSGSPIPIRTSIATKEGVASVCNANGQLLFYTDGSSAWDKDNNIMPNGDNLTGINDLNVLPAGIPTFTFSTTQGALVIPMPDQPDQYYIFSLVQMETYQYYGRLSYSIVDMTLNGGSGDIIPNKKGIVLDSLLSEKMVSIVGEHCNIWLLTHASLSKDFKVWHITTNGIDPDPVVSAVGNSGRNLLGVLKAAPNRKRLISCNSTNRSLELFDFNPATGIVSNILLLDQGLPYYGAAFSPDNSKLYTTNESNDDVFQFDLTASDPAETKLIVGSAVNTDLKLGPDGKIYLAGESRLRNKLSVINRPNQLGAACQFMTDAIQLLPGTIINLGLPNSVPIIVHDTLYAAQTTKAEGCFSTLLLKANNDSTGWDYIWNNGTYEASVAVKEPGTYWVSYHTPPCNFNVDTFHVNFSNGVLPDIDIQSSCKGSANGKAWATTYPGDTVTYHYTWKNESGAFLSTTDSLVNVSSGNYTLQVKTAHCDTVLTIFIADEDYKVAFHADSIICQGTELLFNNTSDSAFVQFYWDFGDQNNSILHSPNHTYPQAGNYKVSLIGIGAICSDTATQTIIVDSLFSGRFSTQPDSICVGESIAFYPDADSTAFNLHWQFGDGAEVISNKEEKIEHAYEVAGVLSVIMHAQFRACPDTSFTDTVHVYALPKVDLGPNVTLCPNNAPLILKNMHTSPNEKYHTYWNTGDTTENLKVKDPGTYSLTIRTAPLGCSNTGSVEVEKDCYMDIPNAFTPNGDGENDYFFPRQLLSQGITDFKMKVLNRWGQVVFETSSIEGRGWDGRFNGKEQPQGVYIYVIKVEIEGGHVEAYEGNVTLLR